MFSLSGNFDANLFDDFRRFEGEFDRLLARGVPGAGIRAVQRGTFPPVNVGATPEQIDVYLFAASLDPKTLDLSLQQNLLVVAGKRSVTIDEEADYYRHERFDGEFRRAVSLPDDVDPDRVDATYRDGVLRVTIQRRDVARPRQITVN